MEYDGDAEASSNKQLANMRACLEWATRMPPGAPRNAMLQMAWAFHCDAALLQRSHNLISESRDLLARIDQALDGARAYSDGIES